MKDAAVRAADPTAVTLSGLCLAHCLALPMLSVSLPVFGAWAEAEWIHLAVILLAAPLAFVAFSVPGARKLMPMAFLGLGCMVIATQHWTGPAGEVALNTVGGLLLAAAHLINWRRRHRAARRRERSSHSPAP